MSRDCAPPADAAPPTTLNAEVFAITGPAWIIEPLVARIATANPAACAAWGADRLDGAPLDRAMPAVRELSAFAQQAVPPGAEREAALLFWTAKGAQRLLCRCRRLHGASGAALVLVYVPATRPGATPAEALDAERRATGERRRGGAPSVSPLAELAHELRTPLSAIVAIAEIMKEERLGPMPHARYLDYAGDIYESARHALSVADTMLGRESLESGRLPVHPCELDVNALAGRAVSAMRPLAEQAGVRLETRLAHAPPRLFADRRCLMQILFNLLANALKFTPRDGTITVATSYRSGNRLEIVVADSGAGMSEAEIVRALARATETAPPSPTGSGYGLPLAKALAEANGATLSIESTKGQGTRVCVAFPAERTVKA